MKSETFDVYSPDKAVKIDVPRQQLRLHPGETAQYTTRNVVDLQYTKNYTDASAQGTMVVTTLRLIFTLDNDQDTNVSVGYKAIQKIMVGNIDSNAGTRGTIVQQDRTLVLVCQLGDKKFRFEFLPRGSRQVFDIVQTLYRAYDTSRAFRVTKTRQLMQNYLLPGEFIQRAFRDVALQSPLAPQPVPGQLQLTGFRLVWFNQDLNLLSPYVDIQGIAVDLETNHRVIVKVSPPDGGAGTFEFSLAPFTCQADELYSALLYLIQSARATPNYGVSVIQQDQVETPALKQPVPVVKEQKIIPKSNIDRVFAYLLEDEQTKDLKVEQDDELGVAFEVADGISREDLM